ncbi:enolase-phosphatase E1 [Episyrphus balteatus]|uniref:enolase-phosphatase E1 n=1 Tax=Episyrphus balteatus TaxID=286459 RepID=UPI002485E41E|nr:enolase-phosphatase E1 [Episyrphus balteatus]
MHTINAKIVLCDIEGTTTSISFVKDVLFPYAKDHAKNYLQTHWHENETKQIVADLINLAEYKNFQSKPINESDITVETVTEFVLYLIEKDLKLGPLKTLQGLIWNHGYVDKTIKGHIYEDVPPAFEKWTKNGIKICIYSSGSVMAQKMLFANSDFGNLMPFLTDYFDTAIGNKRESKSYTKIVQHLDVDSQDILFLTDITAEGKAALEAGMQVIILQRPGNAPLTDDEQKEFIIVKNFDEIQINKK